MCAVPCAPL
jgi:hypothetical protein